MSCPNLVLAFRIEHGHGHKILAAQLIDGEITYRIQWKDSSQSTVSARDAITNWSRLLFDFLIDSTKWYKPNVYTEADDVIQPIETDDVDGQAMNVLCKSNYMNLNSILPMTMSST